MKNKSKLLTILLSFIIFFSSFNFSTITVQAARIGWSRNPVLRETFTRDRHSSGYQWVNYWCENRDYRGDTYTSSFQEYMYIDNSISFWWTVRACNHIDVRLKVYATNVNTGATYTIVSSPKFGGDRTVYNSYCGWDHDCKDACRFDVNWEVPQSGTYQLKAVTYYDGNCGDGQKTGSWIGGLSFDADYKVYHQKQQTDGSYVTVETQTLHGPYGQYVTPARRSYTGYWSPAGQTVLIKQDGSTTVTYKYDLKKSTLTVDPNSGKYLGSEEIVKYEDRYFGETQYIEDPEKLGYLFSGWNKTGGSDGSLQNKVWTFGGYDATLTARWTPITY